MPKDGLVFTNQISQPPFTLNGQPFSNRPESLKGVSEKRRKTTADKNPDFPKYLNEENYYSFNLDTRNIIGNSVSSTTLRAENESYILQFIALHRNLWYNVQGETRPQVSLFFMTPNTRKMYHICIPIEYVSESKDENLFLKFWLYQNPPPTLPPGFTGNEILNFRGNPLAQFAVLNYTFDYNQQTESSSYTLCIFNTALKINKNNLPSWIQNDLQLSKTVAVPQENEQRSYMRKTFDEIFNLMLAGKVKKYSAPGKVDPFLYSDCPIFTLQGRNQIVTPSYYSVEVSSLTGKLLTQSFSQTRDGQQTLKNVKCYPIDIVNQINPTTGEIVIDEETNKPIDPKDAVIVPEEESLQAQLEAKQTRDWWIYFIVTAVVLAILSILIIAISIYTLSGKSEGFIEVKAPAPVATP